MKWIKSLKRPLSLWLTVVFLLSSIMVSLSVKAADMDVANIIPRYYVFQGKPLNVFGKTHNSHSAWNQEKSCGMDPLAHIRGMRSSQARRFRISAHLNGIYPWCWHMNGYCGKGLSRMHPVMVWCRYIIGGVLLDTRMTGMLRNRPWKSFPLSWAILGS